MKSVKIVTEKTLVRRINRALRPDHEQLRRPRSAAARESVGEYCIWSWSQNAPGECHVDLADLGHRLGVLADHEAIAEVPA